MTQEEMRKHLGIWHATKDGYVLTTPEGKDCSAIPYAYILGLSGYKFHFIGQSYLGMLVYWLIQADYTFKVATCGNLYYEDYGVILPYDKEPEKKDGEKSSDSALCVCDTFVMANHGCKCGAFQREQRMKAHG